MVTLFALILWNSLQQNIAFALWKKAIKEVHDITLDYCASIVDTQVYIVKHVSAPVVEDLKWLVTFWLLVKLICGIEYWVMGILI